MLGLLVHPSFDMDHGAGYTDGAKWGKLGSEFTPSHWEMEMISFRGTGESELAHQDCRNVFFRPYIHKHVKGSEQ